MTPTAATGATKIMVIRHAEKPGTYSGQAYAGVSLNGLSCGKSGAEDLVTIGWQRAGALVSLFAPPWGPKAGLATPQFLFAADPDPKKSKSSSSASSGDEPSQRPYETITPLAALLGVTINKDFSKNHFSKMVDAALQCPGDVLICWQHQDIALGTAKQPGISQVILTKTGTTGTMGIPATWPTWPATKGTARYDLVFVFDRPSGTGPITAFSIVPQLLLAGDHQWQQSG
ncbi:MAG TPA: hypothetical protein VKE96_21240 [Vicinamibacterales bacterium]|nr:hypothetical protein [Vicinamibacterales bacterium]